MKILCRMGIHKHKIRQIHLQINPDDIYDAMSARDCCVIEKCDCGWSKLVSDTMPTLFFIPMKDSTKQQKKSNLKLVT